MEKNIENYNDLINEYLYINDPNKEITIDERMSVLISKLNSKNLEGNDYVKYVSNLRNILFNENERNNNVDLQFIKDNELSEITDKVSLSGILTVNKKDFIENPECNLYYYLSPNTGVLPISKSNLQEKINNKTYEYFDVFDSKIPGIVPCLEENNSLKR